jgi:pimeloyl-ACP methyl ester carboxylesterase
MIAQRVALGWPQRVRSLNLVCTTPGGPNAVRASDEVMAAMVQGGEDPSTVYRRNAWFLYGETTRTRHPERIEQDIEYRVKIPTSPHGYLGQLQAAMHHNTWDALPSLAVPTLVLHGDADLLIPTQNGRLLAERIPHAELVLIPGAGHMLQTDGGELVREATLRFLARVGAQGDEPATR